MSGYVRRVRRRPDSLAARRVRLDIELTERCNNDCVHCCVNRPSGDSTAKAREMRTARIKDLLRQAASAGYLEVRFTGGEPLLRPDFEELYVCARRQGLKVMIFTNACLFTPRLADVLARIPPLREIEVTVYGMRAESYETVTRTPGSFERFRRGVGLLLERKIPFVFKTAVLPPNRGEVAELEAWAQTIPWMTQGVRLSMFFDRRHRRDDEEKSCLIASLRVSPEEGLALQTRDPDGFRKGIAEFASKFVGPPGDKLFGCGAGRGACVDAYGRVQPCLSLRAPELTRDLLEVSRLTDILDGFSRLESLRASNPEYLRRCSVCFLKGLCEQCPAKSWIEHGNLDTPVEYLCRVAHEQARWLGWLGEGEYGWEVSDWKGRLKKFVENNI